VNWAESAPLTLGVEEELMILDAETLELAPRVDVFLGRDGFKTELFATMLELNTPVLQTPEEVGEALGSLRIAAAEVAEANGLRIAASGSHPISDPEEQEIVDEPRYRGFVEWAGVSARRQGVHGLHVHVGMPDLGTCLRVMEGALRGCRRCSRSPPTRRTSRAARPGSCRTARGPCTAPTARAAAGRLARRRGADGRARDRQGLDRPLVGRAARAPSSGRSSSGSPTSRRSSTGPSRSSS
jgi:hypothetical protein